MERFERYRRPLAVIFAVLLPLLVYRANSRPQSRMMGFDRVVLDLTRPLAKLLLTGTGAVADFWSHYVDLVGAREEAARLQDELGRLRSENARLKAEGHENARFRQLLEIQKANLDADFLTAEVVGAGSSATSRTLAINKGHLDGVFRGAPVIAGDGLVGIVQRVSWHSSDVLLIADERMKVRARVARSRARGVVEGAGLGDHAALHLNELLRSDDVQPGDRVETNAWGGVFPAGIAIGTVQSVHQVEGLQQRQAKLEPAVDFARLELVSVLIAPPKAPVLVTPKRLLPPSLLPSPEDYAKSAKTPEPSPLMPKVEKATQGARP